MKNITKKVLKKVCYFCEGKGCKRCKQTGVYKDYVYQIIYKGQAFWVDELK